MVAVEYMEYMGVVAEYREYREVVADNSMDFRQDIHKDRDNMT
jgi:DNA/RNA endonuclease YhcR with UshA esterase domain